MSLAHWVPTEKPQLLERFASSLSAAARDSLTWRLRWIGMKKPPRPRGLRGCSGARGTRTPKPFRALAFEASALPFCQRSEEPNSKPHDFGYKSVCGCPDRRNGHRVEWGNPSTGLPGVLS